MNHKIHVAIVAAVLATGGAVAWAAADEPAEAETTTVASAKGAPAAGAAGNGRVTEPLREEHKELLPHIAAMETAGDAIGTAPREAQVEQVHASYEFLTKQLIPHAIAEDKVLYVEVNRLIGSNGSTDATDTMVRDHTEVGTLTERLGTLGGRLEKGKLSTAEEQDLRQVLYTLNGVVGLHFAKEEEVYLPLLDRELTAEQAQQMFEEMEKVTASAGGASHGH
jgi:iron-sulfur cluster repair protein YtfE (RIC family)